MCMFGDWPRAGRGPGAAGPAGAGGRPEIYKYI